MNKILSRTLSAAVLLCLFAGLLPAAQDLNIVDLQYQENGNRSRMVLQANLPFMYEIRNAGSGTIIVQTDRANIDGVASNYTINAKAVKNISVAQNYDANGREITEIIVKYDPSFQFRDEIKGRRLFISFVDSETALQHSDAEAAFDEADMEADEAEETDGERAEPIADSPAADQNVEQVEVQQPEPAAVSARTETEVPTTEDGVYRLEYITFDKNNGVEDVRLSFSRAISRDNFRIIPVGAPARYVLDFHGARNTLKRKNLDTPSNYFSRIRTAQNRLEPYPISRVVLDQDQYVSPVIMYQGNELILRFGDQGASGESEYGNASGVTSSAESPATAEKDLSDESKGNEAGAEKTASAIEPLKIESTDKNSEPAEEVKLDSEEKPHSVETVKTAQQTAASEERKPEAKDKTADAKTDDPSTNPFSPEYIAPEDRDRREKPEEQITPEKTGKVEQSQPELQAQTNARKPASVEKSRPEPQPARPDSRSAPAETEARTDMFDEQFPDSNRLRGGRLSRQDEQEQQPQALEPSDSSSPPSTQQEGRIIASGDREFFQTREISQSTTQYTGRKVNLEFESISLSQLILLLGQMTDKNFLVDPSVRDVEISIFLKDTPWDQALDVILDYHGLGKVEDNNLIRIATQQKLAEEAASKQQLTEQRALAVPLRQITKPINYAKASDLSALITRNLSQKGEVVVDDRTNTLVISDIPSKVDEHLNLIEALDVPTKQVIVEARIVETTRDFINEFGLSYGFVGSATNSFGTSTGMVFPHNVTVGGGFTEEIGTNLPGAINLPAPNANTSILGTFTNIAGSFALDVLLTAAEQDRKVRVLSRPRISASNNQEAEIASGVEVPFQVIQNNTVSIRFREASLKLTVTPHITSDSTVIMDIEVDKSSLGIQTQAGFTIQTRRATSTIRVKDGGVAVIGGVLEISETQTRDAVPGLSKIPLLGALFRNNLERTQNTELLIFVSPKIIG